MPFCTVLKGERFKKISLENLLNLEADFSFASWFVVNFLRGVSTHFWVSTTECTRNDRNWIVPILVNNNISNNASNKNISHNYINSNYHCDNDTVDNNYDDN
jgi:hypothetical protein